MRCQVCDATAGPKIARPSTIPSMCDWNDTLGVDIFYAHDINDEKHAFLSVVDFGTTYHLVAKVEGTSADVLEAKFNELWILPFGPPKTIVLDLEGGPQVALGRLCDWHSITVRSVATQSHWQAGMVERQQAWWKAVWDRVIYQMSVGSDEVDITVPIVNGAKNELRKRCGYSPAQWVFGKLPRVPEDLRDPDAGEKFVWDVTVDSRFQRQAAIRAAARIAFHQSQTDSRLRKALLQRTRVASRPFEIGESVHFWFKPKNRRRGEWAGPAVIVGKEGGNLWLSKSGRCRLTSPEHVRPTTPEEVGELLAMKGTQKEVEKLLEYDPDDDQHFDEFEDMDLDEYVPSEPGDIDGEGDLVLYPIDEIAEEILPAPRRRLKRKTAPDDTGLIENEAMMLRSDLTRRGVEKRKEKELKWSEIPQERCRPGEDPQMQMGVQGWSSPATLTPILERNIFPPMHRDIRCAFLTGSYLVRELYMHQPRTGFPGMSPGELVKIKKNVFGLATSPHEWWNDLRSGIFAVEVILPGGVDGDHYKFEQCALDPCVFMLRKWTAGGFLGEPVGYIGCHVDDILIAAPKSLQGAVQKALSGTFPIDEWEEDEFEFLGSKIAVTADGVELSQEKYATTRLFQLELPANAKDEDPASAELISDNRSLIGALSWMSSTSRPDLTCSVSMAQQLQKNPTHGDIRFTNQTANKAIQFKNRGLQYKAIPDGKLMIVIYHDAAWANVPEPDPEEDYYVLTYEDNMAGLQREGPYASNGGCRKAKKGNSKVASQLGVLVTFMDRSALCGEAGNYSIADWRSQAGQRVCRSTFGAETQACAEGLETGQYIRSMYESMVRGVLVTVDEAKTPLLCLSDCRSLYDHLNKQGIPRVASDKRLAVDLAALRQGLRSEAWGQGLPIGWVPGSAQRADVLTKPQNPAEWWELADAKVLLPIAVGQEGGQVCDRQTTQRTSVKLERSCVTGADGLYPYEYSNHTGLKCRALAEADDR
ncbi:Copia protein [Symbiodinium microadriaticum]|uniref:Copia protein n=1 Tax=Symbiodinium microadriaticum TaxID=2951 RepID=A0A1Q9BY56_SYMMI|nr:Copia protein [Symbiodinium microadriaticum]